MTQHPDTQSIINALAGATVECGRCHGNANVPFADETQLGDCPDCNGTGRTPHPQSELLRVECDQHDWYLHLNNDCPRWRPATPEEAESAGLKLLELTHLAIGEIGDDYGNLAWATWIEGPVKKQFLWAHPSGPGTPLLAILNALAQSLGVEVTANV